MSTLFLLLVVSTAIVLRSFLLRRRYRLRLEEQFDEIFRQPGDTPGTSRRRNFGAKPKLWNTWVKLDEKEKDSTNELAAIKVCCISRSPPPLLLQSWSLLSRLCSRSLLCMFHKRQINPRTRPPYHKCLGPNKTVCKRGLPPSWLVSSTPIQLHFSGSSPLKPTAPEVTQPTHLQKYLARLRSRSSSPCPLQPAEHHPYPTPRRKSFPTLRLDSLDCAFPMNNILVSTYFVFLGTR